MWTTLAAPVDGADARLLLREYYVEIVARYWQRPPRPGEVDQAMAEQPSDSLAPPSGVLFVARYAGNLGGCAGVRLVGPATAELKRVYVRPAYRGTGGGAALLAAAESAARDLGAATIRLDTRRDLVEARRLYARHGYAETAPHNDDPYAEHWFAKPLR